MEKVTIIRTVTGDQGTFGHLVCGRFHAFSIELPWRDNAPNISCIPPGIYEAQYESSPKFKRKLYEVKMPAGSLRSEILFHTGNWAGDRFSGWYSDFEGCIGLGDYIDQAAPRSTHRLQWGGAEQ